MIKFDEKRLDRIFSEVKDTIPLSETVLLTPSTVYGVVPQSELSSKPHQSTKDDFEVTPASVGDFVISMSSFKHGFEHCNIAGGISPDYTVLRPNFHEDIGRFLKYSLKSPVLVNQLTLFRSGIRQGQRLQWNRVRYLKIPVPNENTAKGVADFLDEHVGYINELIEKKELMVSLYPEKIEAVIHESLSDENTEMLPFGFITKQIARPVKRDEESWYTPIGLYNRGRGIFHKDKCVGAELGESTFNWLKEGDLIFSGQFAWEGAVALASEAEEATISSHRYPIYRAIGGIKTSYVFSYFRSHRGRFLMEDCSRGSAGRNRPLNTNRLQKEKIPIPSIKVQEEVERLILLEREFKKRNSLSIIKLQELKTALITEAVTGQLDIKAWKKKGGMDKRLDNIEEAMAS